ncbi:SRPBCC family protein, partial [Actinophytocola sp.]|uniref:SRPBCC family protein n=1 Tax=Actinophytocola sp. TaxID=1872138 RepID=UPI002D7FE07C
DVEVVQAVRVLAARPAAVWPLICDHDLYGRLAPNLSTVEVISDPGEPLRRRCVDTAGNSWSETCVRWEPGRRFAVEVDTTDYPYPLTMMRGLWQVDPHPTGSRITLRFVYQAAPALRGGLFAVGLRVLFPVALRRILHGWQRIITSDGERVDTPVR